MSENDKSKKIIGLENPPVKGKRVIVVSKTFRSQGYISKDGIWRDCYRREEIKDVIGWMEIGE